jgi:hypothetical protein
MSAVMSLRLFIRWGTIALLLLVAGGGGAEPVSPWQRVVVIGASASAGFTVYEPFGGTNTLKCRLSYYVESALATPHEPVRNLAVALLFLNPEGLGQQQVEVALTRKPTLLMGVDFLFWYGYGDGLSDDERRLRFNRGLKLLESFQCPMVVGDIPDASYATNSGIISPGQVPSPAVLAWANQRLKEWAALHTNVTILPLAHLMKAIVAHESLTGHGEVLTAKYSAEMLQADHLHPTPRGAAWLALEALDVFTAKGGAALAREVRWNPETVYQAGLKLSQQPAKATSPAAR